MEMWSIFMIPIHLIENNIHWLLSICKWTLLFAHPFMKKRQKKKENNNNNSNRNKCTLHIAQCTCTLSIYELRALYFCFSLVMRPPVPFLPQPQLQLMWYTPDWQVEKSKDENHIFESNASSNESTSGNALLCTQINCEFMTFEKDRARARVRERQSDSVWNCNALAINRFMDLTIKYGFVRMLCNIVKLNLA